MKICIICGVEFVSKPRQKICSDTCLKESHRRNCITYDKRKVEEIGIEAWRRKRSAYYSKYYYKRSDRVKQQRKEYKNLWYKITADECILAYGGKCNCCGESERKFLTIDHIYNDGYKYKGRYVRASIGLYSWLKKNGFPKDNFQVLCFNCNLGRALNSGICPHEIKRFIMAEEKNKLVSQTVEQKDPYRARGSDFPAANKPAPDVPANYPYGWAEGHNELVKAPCGNRNLEDGGDMTPSVWGKGGKAFPVTTNRGEGSDSATSVSYMNGVDLVTGKFTGGSPTPVGEVTDMNVHIPAGEGKASVGVGNRPVGSASVGIGTTK